MATNYKIPPAFGEVPYATWRNEINMWSLVTDLPAAKQALAVALSLKGKARDTALAIDAKELNTENGMKVLLESLDKIFKKDAIDSAYSAYTEFDSFRRREEMTITDYIVDFENRSQRIKKHEMNLPDAILAFKLLDNAGLSVRDRQLALTACGELSYSHMKSALKRIFSNEHKVTNPTHNSEVKTEPVDSVLAAENSNYRKRDNYKFSRNSNSTTKSKPSPKGSNPLNKFGQRTKCVICESIFHYARDCPNKEYAKCTTSFTDVESVNITLFTNDIKVNEVFVIEASGAAVLDTACTKTVCGRKWLSDYIQRLPMNCQTRVNSVPSLQQFRFGDGLTVKSEELVTIPACINGTVCNIATEVVDCDLPLLLSKQSLKNANAIIDIQQDKVSLFGSDVPLEHTSSGHYCISILNDSLECANNNTSDLSIQDVLKISADLVFSDQQLTKLHKQFGHASHNKLSKLLHQAGVTNPDTFSRLQDIISRCELCLKYKKPSPKPAVSLPLANDFNDVVALDLHEIRPSLWYFHMIDLFTRFSAAVIINNKRASTIVNKFIQYWISIHGACKTVLSDNGREFDNSEFREMAEKFNISVKTTAAESAWSNGVVERHNKFLTEILVKVKSDTSCDWETALAWSLNAKNSLESVHGYSPHQLVYGSNPNLPSTVRDNLPALEGVSVSDYVRNHLCALHEARKAFTEAENSERIRRALRKQTRTFHDTYKTGESVYYKRLNDEQWHGPGTVIGQDGTVIFVRHGGTYVRVHQCRLYKSQSTVNKEQNDASSASVNKEKNQKSTEQIIPEQIDKSSPDDCMDLLENDVDHQSPNVSVRDERQHDVREDVTQHESSDSSEMESIMPNEPNSTPISTYNYRPGDVLQYNDMHTNEPTAIKVISRAGKSTGSNKYWYNVEFQSPDDKAGIKLSMDLSKISDLKSAESSFEPQCNNVLISDGLSFESAKLEELNKWKEFNVYDAVLDEGQKCISTRWICTIKDTQQGTIQKARLVARGFEDIEIANVNKDSPTCSKEALRLVLALFGVEKWKIHSMDVKTAFLQGCTLKRDIFLRPPVEAKTCGVLWHLKKCVYGLGDASLHWYKKVREVMIECGASVSSVDPAVFFWVKADKGLCGALCSHVDDFVWAGHDSFKTIVIDKIRTHLNIGREESNCLRYIGLNLYYVDSILHMDQVEYIDNLQLLNFDKRLLEQNEHVSSQLKSDFRSKVGQINWITTQTRPDCSYDSCNLATKLKQLEAKDLSYINKVIRKLKSEIVSLKFPPLGSKDNIKIVIYSDAALGNLPDGGSQGAYIILLVGENNKCSLLDWQSKRIRRVVRSSLAAETIALSEAIDSGIFLAQLYSELTVGKVDEKICHIECVTDNKSLIDAIYSTNQVTEKRLRIEISGIRELIKSGKITSVQWKPTQNQLADCLTKFGASSLCLLKVLERCEAS